MSDVIHVLVVDDDPDVRTFLQDYLSEHDYRVTALDGGPALREYFATGSADLVLLDVGLPGEDGLSLARFVREHCDVGIIMVSGAGDTVDRIVGLEVGADDYLGKPFEPRELLARVKSVLRRYRPPWETASAVPSVAAAATRRVPVGRCTLDLDTRQLFDIRDQEIALTSMEFDLLQVFVERPNRPLTRDQLLNLTQNRDWNPYDRSIDIRITRLRRKLEADPEKPQVIRTVRGVGYMYVPVPA